jgi:hypothetical protein
MYTLFHQVSVLCFSLLLLFQSTFALAQGTKPASFTSDTKIQAKELQEDFLILRKVLEEAHPGLYRYTNKKTLDARFDKAFIKLNKDMSEREFYKIIASILSVIKDGHLTSRLSSGSMSYLKTFPLSLRFIKGKAYILSSPNDVIIPGSELLSINGEKMTVIIRKLLAFLPADGDIETRKYRRLDTRFRLFYNLFIEQPDSFDVGYYDPEKRQKKKITLPPLIENEAQVTSQVDDGKKPLRIEFLPELNTSVLTIKSFDRGSITKAGQDYPKFLEAAFQEIKTNNIQNLIIDLRNNGGGNDVFGSLLFSYLVDKEFRYYDYLETSTNKITLAQYVEADPERDRMFAEDLLPAVAGRYRIKESVHPNLRMQQPQKNHFNGKVWYLVNGSSFSVTAEFASIAHYHQRGSFVGEEVGGAYYGNNSGYQMRLRLPNTKIRVYSPLWKYVLAVSGYLYPGRGVIPNFPVQPNIQDVLNGVDTEMLYTLKLIAK